MQSAAPADIETASIASGSERAVPSGAAGHKRGTDAFDPRTTPAGVAGERVLRVFVAHQPPPSSGARRPFLPRHARLRARPSARHSTRDVGRAPFSIEEGPGA